MSAIRSSIRMTARLPRALTLYCCLIHAACWALDSPSSDAVIQEIRDTGVVKIGYLSDNRPFSFPNGSSVAGFSIDLCSKVAERLRRVLGLNVAQKYIEVRSEERIPKLQSHEIHMECGASTNTVERQSKVAFSYTIFVSNVRMLVPKDGGIAEYRDLAGKRVTVLRGSTALQAITLRLRNLGVQARITEVASDSEAVELLEAGKADVYVNDEIFLFGLKAGMKRSDAWIVAGAALTVEPYAIMLPKNAPKLISLVDSVMGELFRSGEFMQIYDRWFLQAELKMPVGRLLKESIQFPNKIGMPETW